MTPGKRLDQIEPIIGDILKTQDEHTAQNKEILYRQDEHTGQMRELTRLLIESAVTQARTKRELTDQMKKTEMQLNERIDGLGERIDGLDGRIDRIELGQTDLTMKVDLILKIL